MILDILEKKRRGQRLTKGELKEAFEGYMTGAVKDYQMSALLMAICIQDMDDQEVLDLTDLFLNSGKRLDLSFLEGIKVDKHSTGGVGDKTTLIVGPIVASCGVPFIKMSGRGLGYTGGTIDKLESIEGMRLSLSFEEVKQQALEIGLVITSQTASLTPMDQKIYALRDVTGTTKSIPFIASSIMSKKIAGGADKIVIDIKVGEGALLETEAEAKRLASLLQLIGNHYQKEVRCLISSMDQPLGHAIGNKIEVLEAMKVLKGEEKGPLWNLSVLLATHLVSMAKNLSLEEAEREVNEALISGRAWEKFKAFVSAQGGDLTKLAMEASVYEIKASKTCTIQKIHALACAKFALNLGTGRIKKEDTIDYNAGIYFEKEGGSLVKKGEVVARIYTNKENPVFDIKELVDISV